jgi:hypothetical protein
LSLRSDDLDSVGEFYTEKTFGNWLWPSRRGQLLSAASVSLKIMAGAVLFERHPLERTVRWRMVAWITSKEAKSLFSQMEDQYAFGEMAEVGKQNLASFASVLGDGCLFEFMQVEDRVSFIRKSGGAAR